jgi:bifunctional UDP-N-acetylglucosamine pyrophosphorylase/glucosamine-1-phosphate N-acetyltransferase
MKSALPKVMHTLCGKPLVHYPIAAALEAGCGEVVVVVGHGREHVEKYVQSVYAGRVKTTVQTQQRGTGDAASAGMSAVSSAMERVLVFYGDVPLLMAEDLARVVRGLDTDREAILSIATCVLDDPFGYGRILRDAKGNILEVREQRDLTSDAERAIKEMNPGIYCAPVGFLRDALAKLEPNNAQGELYLTDIVKIAGTLGKKTVGVDSRKDVIVGINDRDQLATAERTLHDRIVKKHRLAGVTIREGARIDEGVEIGQDTVIETGVCLRGKTRIGKNVVVDVGCVLTNVTVADGVVLKPYSVGTDSVIGPRAQIGPFSHLRPETDLGEDVHVGNFVETKKTKMDKGAKANHLAYLGDGVIGPGVNVGAGTIFCNYDGFMKHTTVIEEGAFIGSDSQIVAPITIGAGAYVATGTTVTKNVPPNALAISRVKQENKEEYASKLKAKLKAAKEAAATKKR